MANWQLILNTSGLVLLYFSGKFAKSAWNISQEGNVTSFIFHGGLCLCTVTVAIMSFHGALMKPAASHTFYSLIRTYGYHHILLPVLGKIIHRSALKDTRNPQKFQDELLMNILKQNGETAFAIDHGLDKIKSRKEFIEKFPLTTFSAYEKYVDRIANYGEENVMTKSKVIHLSVTSGTTGKNKMYPHTRHDSKTLAKFFLTLLYNISKQHDMRLDRELSFRLSNPVRKSSAGITIGPMSAAFKIDYVADVVPLVHRKVMLEKPSFFIQALFGLRERDIAMIRGYSSDLMYSFFKSIEHNQEKLFQTIKSGHIEPFPELDEDIRDELNKLLTPDEDRATDLRDIFAAGSVGLAKRIWPRLRFSLLAKTGGFHQAAKILENSYLKEVPFGFYLHGSTEGFFGLTINTTDMEEEIYTFMPVTFLEFIKVKDMEKENPKTYLMEELEVGQLYELVVTNYHGLYRNRFGDVIKVVGFTNNTPKYTFQYRTGSILNCGLDRTSEKLMYEALKDSESQWNLKIESYTTTESMNLEAANGEKYGRNHYVVIIEFEEGVLLTREQCDVLEVNLCKRHESYAEFRGIKSLGHISIIQVKPGTFSDLRLLMFGDHPNVQFKMPRVLRKEKLLSFLWKNKIMVI